MKPIDDIGRDQRKYRTGRAVDAIKILPFIGLFAFMLPILWQAQNTKSAVIFVFVAWTVLAAIGFIFANRAQPNPTADDNDDDR